jgi:hypothetical protein
MSLPLVIPAPGALGIWDWKRRSRGNRNVELVERRRRNPPAPFIRSWTWGDRRPSAGMSGVCVGPCLATLSPRAKAGQGAVVEGANALFVASFATAFAVHGSAAWGCPESLLGPGPGRLELTDCSCIDALVHVACPGRPTRHQRHRVHSAYKGLMDGCIIRSYGPGALRVLPAVAGWAGRYVRALVIHLPTIAPLPSILLIATCARLGRPLPVS